MLATLSVVFAFVFAPVGAVLGHLARSQIRRSGQDGAARALVGLTLSYVVIVVSVAAVVVWAVVGTGDRSAAVGTSPPASAPLTTTRPPPPPPLVDAAGLPALLPSLDEIRDIMKSPDLVVSKTWTELEVPDPAKNIYAPAECLSAMIGGEAPTYEGSGFHAYFGLSQQDSAHAVDDAVATFDNAAAASAFVSKTVDQWRVCAGKKLAWAEPQEHRYSLWALGEPVESGGVTTIRDVNGQNRTVATAVRAVAAKANVAVDIQVVVSGELSDEAATTIATRILDRIPG
jgi:hypothetical protein